VRPGFLLLCAAPLLWLAGEASGERDPRLDAALPQLAKEASRFWQYAPRTTAREALKQKTVEAPKRKLRVGQAAVGHASPELRGREIVSYYGFAAFHDSPEALHEFREVTAVDGSPAPGAENARRRLEALLESGDDRPKQASLANFEKNALDGTATDFGQLILLFTRGNQSKYSFEMNGTAMVGADRALVIRFEQRAGNESLHISEGRKRIRKPLEGQLWVREGDYAPLRISLTARRREAKVEIRDEASVDYAPSAAGCVLPASVVYRQFLNDQLRVENVYQYSDWAPVKAP
jgi:hypothetical protein